MTNKYQREIKPGVFVDVYDVLQAFNVTNPALQHLVKKALAVGQRGHKDAAEDLQDIVDSALRAQELDKLKRQQYKSRADEVLLSRSYKNRINNLGEQLNAPRN